MKEMLEKMMMKKASKGKEDKMSEMEVEAKMDVLKELLGLAQTEMGSRVKSGMDEMQKVTVAAPDKESLLKGLGKAEEITEEMPESMLEVDAEEDEEVNMSEGGIVNDKKTTMNDVMTKAAMDDNFDTKADENPVDPDEEDSMFGTSLKKKAAKKSSYASMMSDED